VESPRKPYGKTSKQPIFLNPRPTHIFVAVEIKQQLKFAPVETVDAAALENQADRAKPDPRIAV
jgi:hypothetical protein